jgi:protein SOK2
VPSPAEAQLSSPEDTPTPQPHPPYPRALNGRPRPFKAKTEKLELPSISQVQVQTRGPIDEPWYNHQYSQRPLVSNEKLPSLSLPLGQSSWTDSSPRTTLGSSSLPPSNTHTSSYTNGNPAHGLKTPSPPNPPHGLSEYGQDQYGGNMNHSQSWDVHQSHMSAGPAHAPLPVTSGGMTQYSHYQQPPLLQPGPSNYSSGGPYGQYGYSSGITSPQSAGHPVSAPMSSQMNAHLLPLPGTLNLNS